MPIIVKSNESIMLLIFEKRKVLLILCIISPALFFVYWNLNSEILQDICTKINKRNHDFPKNSHKKPKSLERQMQVLLLSYSR